MVITSGGENIATGPIEDKIKTQLGIASRVVVIGDNRKYLVALISLKTDTLPSGEQTVLFSPDAHRIVNELGSKSKTVLQAEDDKLIRAYIDKSINSVNSVALTRSHKIKKWVIVPLNKDEMTPTLKTKKSNVVKNNQDIVDKLYNIK